MHIGRETELQRYFKGLFLVIRSDCFGFLIAMKLGCGESGFGACDCQGALSHLG